MPTKVKCPCFRRLPWFPSLFAHLARKKTPSTIETLHAAPRGPMPRERHANVNLMFVPASGTSSTTSTRWRSRHAARERQDQGRPRDCALALPLISSFLMVLPPLHTSTYPTDIFSLFYASSAPQQALEARGKDESGIHRAVSLYDESTGRNLDALHPPSMSTLSMCLTAETWTNSLQRTLLPSA